VVADLAPSQRDKRSIAALRTSETAPPPEQHAESIAVIPQSVVIHDAVPLGGENAIVPRPPAIAYDENAEGTTAFELSIDERGVPVKCTITKPSGYVVLDEAVCRAAMHARFTPRTINGRPVASVYRDAFVFRSGSGG
jgi:TonB family protein